MNHFIDSVVVIILSIYLLDLAVASGLLLWITYKLIKNL